MIIRIVAGLLAVVLVLLQYRIWASPDGMREVWRTREGHRGPDRGERRGSQSATARSRPKCATSRKAARPSRNARAPTSAWSGRTRRSSRSCRRRNPVRRPRRHPPRSDGAKDGPGRHAVTLAVRRWAIVPAAGQGRASAPRVPKQYTPLLGRPMLSWTLAALLAEPRIDGVVVALAAGRRAWPAVPEARIRASAAARAARGASIRSRNGARGARRRRARHGLGAGPRCGASLPAPPRPRALLRPLDADAVGGLLAVPVSDTLKRADGEQRVVARPWRATALARADAADVPLRAAAARAAAVHRARTRVTDEAAAIESLGLRPRLVRGRADNIKVTNPEDAALAEAILRSEQP